MSQWADGENCLSLSFLHRGGQGAFEVYTREVFTGNYELKFSHEGEQEEWRNVLVPVTVNTFARLFGVSNLAAKT